MSQSLPVADIFTQLQSALKQSSRVILQAPPGAGKSTLLPLLLLKQGDYSPARQIVMLEPRRVAARQIAHFLAKQLGEKIGQTIGLRMRGENKTSAQTVLTIVTDGVAVRQLQNDPELSEVALIIFDEFHERALQTDLALALTLDAQELNEEIKVLIMSATLDLETLSAQLDAPIVASGGRQFPVDVFYRPADIIPTIEQIQRVIIEALNEHQSSVLVFLSGQREIDILAQRLDEVLSDDIECFPLYGSLPLEAQVQAIQPSVQGKRKVVLATNIAQTSLTIEGVDVVVDAGVEKSVVYDLNSQNETLINQPISIAAAVQRMGRAGRLRPGTCYRLGAKEQFERRRAFDVAEIERVDVAPLLLEVSLWGAKFDDLFWLSTPSVAQLSAASAKLTDLGCWSKRENKHLNNTQTQLFQKLGSDLRICAMLAQANSDSERSLAALLASVLELPNIPSGDLFTYLLAGLKRDWHKIKPQLTRLAKRLSVPLPDFADIDLELATRLLVSAFPDRIAKKAAKRWKLSGGGSVEFHHQQTKPNSDYVLVLSIQSGQYGHFVQSYIPLELTLLQQELPDLIIESTQVSWSEQKQQPVNRKLTTIGQLILSETPMPLSMDSAQWQELWLDYVNNKGLEVLGWNSDEVLSLRNRMALALEHDNQLSWPDWSEQTLLSNLSSWLGPYLSEVKNLQQLRKLNLAKILTDSLDWSLQQSLEALCPQTYKTPAGNTKRIHYTDAQPKISVKLQEMFGEPQSPAICQGKVALLIELLSPAQRPLQLTQDLAGFWQNAYQEVKKEMKGRYPKHPWPDDPISAIATHKTKRHLS